MPVSTLKYKLATGALPEPKRTPKKYRIWTQGDIDALRRIVELEKEVTD